MALFSSSTRDLPVSALVPRHVAVIMDGNGRWAKKRFLPRVAGHVKGVDQLRELVRSCLDKGVRYLTVFAFSSENWRRPPDEVSLLMQLFGKVLQQELDSFKRHGIRLHVVGDLSRFDENLQHLVRLAEEGTAHNQRLDLSIAANYGGRWDITQALNRLAVAQPERAGAWVEADIEPYLAMSFAPEPDLFIRTGGEERISNFLMWQLAYSELYFTPTLWPEFDAAEFDKAIQSYQKRERRFGRTSEQLKAPSNA